MLHGYLLVLLRLDHYPSSWLTFWLILTVEIEIARHARVVWAGQVSLPHPMAHGRPAQPRPTLVKSRRPAPPRGWPARLGRPHAPPSTALLRCGKGPGVRMGYGNETVTTKFECPTHVLKHVTSAAII